MRRELAQTLYDLAVLWEPAHSPLVDIAPRSLSITQPIELRMRFAHNEPILFADVPTTSWTTGFDDRASTLRISFEAIDHKSLVALANFADGSSLVTTNQPEGGAA